MPTETNLPTMVHLYLELVGKLLNLTDGNDSKSDECQILYSEIRKYFALIEAEMAEVKKAEE